MASRIIRRWHNPEAPLIWKINLTSTTGHLNVSRAAVARCKKRAQTPSRRHAGRDAEIAGAPFAEPHRRADGKRSNERLVVGGGDRAEKARLAASWQTTAGPTSRSAKRFPVHLLHTGKTQVTGRRSGAGAEKAKITFT